MKATSAMLLTLLCGAAAAAEQQLTPNDFGYARDFQTTAASALYEAVLPETVYARLTRADFGDLRVFNAAGEILPHALRQLAAEVDKQEYSSVPYFPVYAEAGASLAGISLTLRQDDSGNVLNVETKAASGEQRRLVAYLIDARALKRPARSLRVAWNNAPSDFVSTYRVDASDDLQHWRSLGSATLAELNFNGQTLNRRDIDIAATETKFLRLSWDDIEALPTLTAVELELQGRVRETARSILPLTHVDSPNADEYRYRMVGNAPVQRAHVTLNTDNALAQINVFSRNNDKEPWQPRGHGVAYRLERQGSTLTSPPIELTGQAPAREWLLRVSPEHALGATVPTIELGFVPHRVTFVARGAGPYLLAYGAREVDAPRASLDTALSSLDSSQRDAQPVALSEERVLGGDARIAEPGLAARTWKSWVLWSVLILGVALLVWMALRLAREMKSGRDNADSPA